MDRNDDVLSNCLPVTRGVRTRLLAILADAYPNTLITNDIQNRLRIKFGCNHRYRRENDDPQHIPAALPRDCKFGNDCPGQCWYAQAYPQLRRLAALGIIEWHPARAGGQSASWRLADPAGDIPDDPPPVPIVDLDSPRMP
ncbi:hypothetical protein [Mycolicibacterium llatzerense]|uniref:hypothetical protein n=1 Tax=Mycolicibacterium llatzerense TaxID=280871 RepID=UPI0021B5C435|nr:hypothetical protein [Mycolicibacterium llatzerense]MCT7367323.1 hypothetical protein [Mycolicibacterium llatzerense]